jgi:superfamily II DNA or RNA helicase
MLCSRGYAVSLSSLSENQLVTLKRQLTVEPVVDEKYKTADLEYKVFTMSMNYIYIPRHFIHHEFQTASNNFKDPVSIHVTFEGSLKSSTHQPEAVEAVLHGLHTNGSGILSLPTGYGKTTVALYILCQMSMKTLIVVHKEFLMNQWYERIQQFIPHARVGRIQANVVDVDDKDIVIGMLQSLSSKEYDRKHFRGFGMTIIDETHHVCTRTFSKLFSKINTKHILGLSATIERKDGLTKVLHWFLGGILFKVERTTQKQVCVECLSFSCPEYESFPINRARQPNIPEAINILTNIPERNQLILQTIQTKLGQNRRVLVLTDRRQHCKDLLESFTCREQHYTGGLYIGGMKPDDLKKSEEASVIFATFSLAYEGLDIPVLDTLILATPKSDIVQSVGRILRETEGKQNDPCVIDIIDEWGPFKYQFFKRSKYYKATGFHIKRDQPDMSGYLFCD